jgi:hypothetical protein
MIQPKMNINSVMQSTAVMFLKFVNEYYVYSHSKNQKDFYTNKATGLVVTSGSIFIQFVAILKLNQEK